ncbi:site-specific DNA-methyltransferase [Paraclostridium bifermentans]|uniref:DNA-methyltransferase n=1 Tax=Paraclostridium TaxID=1849822 RepID=UPI001CC72CBA|nr:MULTISPECIES: site-specific DNA-methyltransferase [Paraclostridium]MBZ6005501.1 site-specific DNA-methyltransferase [Paraclostridium bifermentans]MDU0297970.1 site-specific DNA-methyltransferase [Paraclostridium sp. MRS3W1]
MNIGLDSNKIYNCDYRRKIEELKDKSVDMVLTDIPYLLNKESNLKGIKNYNKKGNSSSWEDPNKLSWDDDFDLENYIYHCCRILKDSASIIVWSSWQQLGAVDELIKKNLGELKGEPRVGVWRKSNPNVTNMDKMAIQPYEFFVWNRKGSNVIFNNQNGKYIDKSEVRQHPELHYYENSSTSNKKLEGKHPTSKPESLFRWLILTYTDEINKDGENSIIFDGCMGGGTTAVAARKEGRDFIGFEKEEEYCKIAKSRLEKLDKNSIYKSIVKIE